MAAFDDVGACCSLKSCGRQDFLPISCDFCKQQFCQDHFRPEMHECEKYKTESQTYCPPCPSASVEQASLRCAAPGCKESMASHNRVRCQVCHQDTCLKHRYETDHPCQRLDDLVKAALVRAAQEVPAAERAQVKETLLKVFGNILNNPGNEKFRSLKKANALVKERLRHPSCIALLKLCRFEDREDVYVCPSAVDLTPMRKTVAALQRVGDAGSSESGGSGVRIVNGVIQRSAPPAQPAEPQGKAGGKGAATVPPAAANTHAADSRAKAPSGGYPAPAKKAADKPGGFERRGLSSQQVHQAQEDALRKAREERKEKYKLEGDGASSSQPAKAAPKAAGTSNSTESNNSSDCTVQ